MGDRMIPKLYVVEWSARQGCAHVHSLERACKINRKHLAVGLEAEDVFDYLPIAFFETMKEADAFLAEALPILQANYPERRWGIE